MNNIKTNRIHNFELAIFLGLIITLILNGMVSFAKDCDSIRNDVLRFHILANSDLQEDQELKLKVRDRVLLESEAIFNKASTKEEAIALANENLAQIITAAQNEIFLQGYNYSVHAEIVNMHFDTRKYDTFTMPAGNYDALRITIGEGKGKNWWCVMFPQMCIPAATGEKPDLSSFSDEELSVIESEPIYEPRFAMIEIWEKFKSSFGSRKNDEKIIFLKIF